MNARRASTSTNKLSAVKRKDKSPQFDSQKQKTDNKTAEDDGHKPRSKRGNKKPRTDKSHGHSHSHLVSVASVKPTIVVPPTPPALQVYMQVKDIPANPPPGSSVRSENQGCIFYQLLTHMGLKQNAQAFTGAPKQRGNTYPHINAARDLADRIGVTKIPLNLKKLETITEKQ